MDAYVFEKYYINYFSLFSSLIEIQLISDGLIVDLPQAGKKACMEWDRKILFPLFFIFPSSL